MTRVSVQVLESLRLGGYGVEGQEVEGEDTQEQSGAGGLAATPAASTIRASVSFHKQRTGGHGATPVISAPADVAAERGGDVGAAARPQARRSGDDACVTAPAGFLGAVGGSRRSSSLSATAPAALLTHEAGALPRPPFRLLTDAPVAGTRRPGLSWSARARRVQSHACAAEPAELDGVDVMGGAGGGAAGMEEVPPAGDGLPQCATRQSSEDCGLEVAAPARVEHREAMQAVDGRSNGGGGHVNPAAEERRTMEQIASLIQKSQLWNTGRLRQQKASSMPHAAAPAWHVTSVHSGSGGSHCQAEPWCDGDAQVGSASGGGARSADVDGTATAQSAVVSSHGYSGVLDTDKDEFILDSSESERPSNGRRCSVGEDQGRHVYTGTLDMEKDEFILGESELESDV